MRKKRRKHKHKWKKMGDSHRKCKNCKHEEVFLFGMWLIAPKHMRSDYDLGAYSKQT